MQDLHSTIYLPRARALNLPVRRSRSQAEPWQPRAVRPGGCLNSSEAGLACFPRAKPGCPVFAAKGGIYTGAPIGRHTSPAERYFIPPEGESPQPVREASADPGQNPGSPGPSGPAAASTLARRASTFGNTGKRRIPHKGP